MKAVDVFLKLVDASYWWLSRQMPSKVRDGTVDTKPGDMIKKMSLEDRAILQNLSSDDISEGKVTEDAKNAAILTTNYYDQKEYDRTLREAKLNFDGKLKK